MGELRKGMKDHDQRKDLAGEHALGDTGQIVLACVFAGVWILDSLVLNYTTFLNQYVPLAVKIPCGTAVLVLSAYLARRGLSIVFGEEREEPAVITKGVFGVVRHPIYLAEILLYLGFLILSTSLAAGAVWVVAIGFLNYISRHEEHLLHERFGEEYEQYMRQVPMWIPRPRRRI